MKRDPEKLRAWQERSRKPLKRTQGPKAARSKPLTAPARDLTTGWHRGIGERCAVCGAVFKRDCEAHHIIRVQTLRKEATRRGFDFDRVRWDKRNRLPVCALCHSRHHARFRPIKIWVIEQYAPKAFQFAREIGLEHVLLREYPVGPYVPPSSIIENRRNHAP